MEDTPYDLTPAPEPDAPSDIDTSTVPSNTEEGFLTSLFSALDSPNDTTPEPETGATNEEPDPEPNTPAEDTSSEADPDLDDAPPGITEQSKMGWKELKSLKKQVEAERDRLRAELDEVRQSTKPAEEVQATQAELEQARQQIEEYERHLATFNVEQSKEYRENIAKPLQATEALIQEYAKAYELNVPDIAAAAMQTNPLERNKLLSELTAGMNDFDKLEFKKAVDDAQALFARSQQARANARESLEYIERKRQEEETRTQQQTQEQQKQAASQVRETLTRKLPFLAENEQAFQDAGEADLASASPEVRVYAAHAAVLLPTIMEKYEAQTKRIAELEAAISKRSSGSPMARSGSVSTKASEPGSDDFMSGLEKVLSIR